MTDFTISITDSEHVYALKAATADYNSRQPAETVALSEAEYLQYVMTKAAESWAKNWPSPSRAKYEGALSELARAKAAASAEEIAKIEAAESAILDVKAISGSWYADNGDGTITFYPKVGRPVTFDPKDGSPEAVMYATWLSLGGKPLPVDATAAAAEAKP